MFKKLIATTLIITAIVTTNTVHAEVDDIIRITPPETIAAPCETVTTFSTIEDPKGFDPVLMSCFMEQGIDPDKSISLATLYNRLMSDPQFSQDLTIAFLAQVMKEGNAGQYELLGNPGDLSYAAWTQPTITDSQRSLAGLCINSPAMLNTGSTLPADSTIGVGMMQWTKERRVVLFNYYNMFGLTNSEYVSPYDLAEVEANLVWMEMQDPYYNRIFEWAQGKDLREITKLVCRVYIGQSSEFEQEYRCGYLPTLQTAIYNYETIKGRQL